MRANALACLAMLLTVRAESSTPPAQRSFSVADAITMTRFNSPNENLASDAPMFSPDGKHFLVITSKGLLRTDRVETSLWAYNTDQVRRFADGADAMPARKLLARVAAVPISEAPSSHAPVVKQVSWSDDSASIYYLAEIANGRWQLCQAHVDTAAVRRVTPAQETVRYYGVHGRTIVYLRASALPPGTEGATGTVQRENPLFHSIRGRTIESLMVQRDPNRPVLVQLCIIRGGRRRVLERPYVDSGYDGVYTPDVLSISPDERTLVRSRPAPAVPTSWSRFEPVQGYGTLRIDTASIEAHSPYNYFRPRQLFAVDLRTGKGAALVDGPLATQLGYADVQSVAWSKTGSTLLFTGSFMTSGDQHQQPEDTRPCSAAVWQRETQKATCLVRSRWDMLRQQTTPEALPLTAASLDQTGLTVDLRYSYPGRDCVAEQYRMESGVWQLAARQTGALAVSDRRTPGQTMTVLIDQAVDRRPVLSTVDVHGAHRLLWDPNRWLARVSMGRASILHWRDKSDYEWTGALVLPVGYQPGRRYPLVIQTHGVQPFRFLTDGFYPTGMAAQALASAGFVVLQIETRRTHYTLPQEVNDQLQGFDSAIEELAMHGIIDPTRVGLAGFSRTCWYVEHALVSEPHRFAAATIADGVDQGYLQYRLFGDTPNIKADSETIHGGTPALENLSSWAARAPAFSADRIQTPLLIQALGQRSILMEWEIYSSLFRRSLPVEFLYFPQAQHILQSPQELFHSQQAVVDWFRSWIQGEERP